MTAREFADIARCLGETTRRLGLTVPAFRAPPKNRYTRRSITWHEDGEVVAVQIRDRDRAAIVEDMVLGVLLVNGLSAGSPQAGSLVEAARCG